ncbi:MAG TPA: DUF2851 domain-containing protein [Bacteroidetes bacterium]|nr:DUF2851 domain-containing protein [Bacteroidota bacterium]
MLTLMNEALFQFIWKMRLFDHAALNTTDGEAVDILHPGTQNHHAGPDFSHARIRIGDTLWAGNAELHLRSSQWKEHGHHHDPAYNNVILHVVLEKDSEMPAIPTIELGKRIKPELLDKYRQWMHSGRWIPCAGSLPVATDTELLSWLGRLAVGRLEDKAMVIAQRLEMNRGDWDETAWQLIARALGNPVNAEPMEQVARSIPLKLLQKHSHDPLMAEALLLGQAGMLEAGFQELMPLELQSRYRHLRKLHGLESLPPGQWKFGRLRPAHFPGVRLSQLAAIVQETPRLFAAIQKADYKTLQQMFQTEASAYWKEHVHLKHASVRHSARLGKGTIDSILINAVVPLLLLWGQQQADDPGVERALDLLEQIPAEDNEIIRKWKKHGIQARHAGDSQALLQLFKTFCNQKRCLSCPIGYRHLQKVTYI